MKFETVIGLEIHVQLKTKTKMFCGCDNAGENLPPNTTICPVCTGQPGVLPIPNQTAVDWAVQTALALGCTIPSESHFDRKHYYYPDLPKGFQISQFFRPIGDGGKVDLRSRGVDKTVALHHMHMEEDAAKLTHFADYTVVDFNRAGTPLLEIVTQPDMRNPQEAKAFMQEIRLLALYLGVSDADMEKGHLRCDASISLRPEGEMKLYQRVEIKNLNSFRAVERALTYEQGRLQRLWERKEYPENASTRSWQEDEGVTKLLREKETSADYRYFPEPDIPPLRISVETLRALRATLPETPWQRRQRFVDLLGFSAQNAAQLVEDKALGNFAEAALSEFQRWLLDEGKLDGEGSQSEIWEQHKAKAAKLTANWTTGELQKLLNANKQTVAECLITPENFAEFLVLVSDRRINSTQAQQLLAAMFVNGGEPDALLQKLDLSSLSGQDELAAICAQAIAEHAGVAADYRSGKQNAIQFLVGQVMRQSKGKADPASAREELLRQLGVV